MIIYATASVCVHQKICTALVFELVLNSDLPLTVADTNRLYFVFKTAATRASVFLGSNKMLRTVLKRWNYLYSFAEALAEQQTRRKFYVVKDSISLLKKQIVAEKVTH